MEKSPQAIYVYLDDANKACNKKFADLLGYSSAREWADKDAPMADVVEEDQQSIITAHGNASGKMLTNVLDVSWKNARTSKIIKTRIRMVPMKYSDHIFVIHFLTKI